MNIIIILVINDPKKVQPQLELDELFLYKTHFSKLIKVVGLNFLFFPL